MTIRSTKAPPAGSAPEILPDGRDARFIPSWPRLPWVDWGDFRPELRIPESEALAVRIEAIWSRPELSDAGRRALLAAAMAFERCGTFYRGRCTTGSTFSSVNPDPPARAFGGCHWCASHRETIDGLAASLGIADAH
jgi:hypothetical protein